MLVLSRKEREAIRIGDDVIVEVLEIVQGKVRLGIVAPASVPVHRAEVWLELQGARGRPLAEVIQEVHRAGIRAANRPPAAAPAPSTTSGASDATGRAAQGG